MIINCGDDKIDITKISYVTVETISDYELKKLEEHYHGDYIDSVMDSVNNSLQELNRLRRYYLSRDKGRSKFAEKLETVLNKYWYEVGLAMPQPKSTNQKRDNWTFATKKQSSFSVGYIDVEGDALIKWEYQKDYGTNAANLPCFGDAETTLSLADDVMPVLQRLAKKKPIGATKTQKKGGFLAFLFELAAHPTDAIYHDDSRNTPEEMQSELNTLCSEYEDTYGKIGKEKMDEQARLKKREEFLKKYANKSVLVIGVDGEEKKYLEDYCGFDIFAKEIEIQKELVKQQKVENSNDAGEKTVEYAIRWFIKANVNKHIFLIKGDCESRYRLNCILLNKPDFVDDPQEYDHILVCSAGIILIETKHWKGVLEIRDDGKWIRQNELEARSGIENPKFQLRRHELMMEKIVPNVKIYSLLCFSNEKLIINGRDNFKDYPIITIEQLEDKLMELCSIDLYSDEEVNKIVETINGHKVSIT